MKILVTGAAGFLGSHLVDRLVADGHRVTGLDDLSSGRLGNLTTARRSKGLHFHNVDVTTSDVQEVIAREGPDIVCHLAARRAGSPLTDSEVNVLGTQRVLLACAHHEVQRVVIASDATALYASAPNAVTERAGLAPATPFGADHVAAESYLDAYRRRYGLQGVALRVGCVYGPRQERGVVASFAKALTRGAPGTIFGDGSTTRDLVHVEDVVDAFLRCLGGKGDGRRLNIGTGVATTIREVHTLVAQTAKAADAPDYAPARAGEPQHVVLDSSAARRALGWEPSTELAEGIAETVSWRAEQRTKS